MENEVKNSILENIEPASKSQLKRESYEIQKLGKRLVGLTVEQLGSIPLDEPVLEAIALAARIKNKRSALKRHYQFLGKLLRARDTSAIITALEQFDHSNHAQIKRHHQAEYWRDEIISRGVEAIESLLTEQAGVDRQKLRQLWRNHSNAKTDARRTQVSRLIYQEVMQAL